MNFVISCIFGWWLISTVILAKVWQDLRIRIQNNETFTYIYTSHACVYILHNFLSDSPIYVPFTKYNWWIRHSIDIFYRCFGFPFTMLSQRISFGFICTILFFTFLLCCYFVYFPTRDNSMSTSPFWFSL